MIIYNHQRKTKQNRKGDKKMTTFIYIVNGTELKETTEAWGAERKEAKELAEKMKKMTLKIRVKAGENGKLFGAVTSKEIAETLKKDFNIDVDKKKIILSESIKNAGTTRVDIKLNEGVMASLLVMIIPE